MDLGMFKDKTTITIMGLKGFGKTYAMVILGNYFQSLGKAVFYFDTLGAIVKTGFSTATHIVVVRREMLKDVKGLRNTFTKLKRSSVIFNLRHLYLDELSRFGDIYSQWAMEEQNGNHALFIDEISDYCPQSKENYSRGLEHIWRDGRNNGIQPVVLSTQRPQTAHKNLLALADIYVIFNLQHNLDRKKIKDLFGMDGMQWETFSRVLSAQAKREAILFYFDEEKRQSIRIPIIMPQLVRK